MIKDTYFRKKSNVYIPCEDLLIKDGLSSLDPSQKQGLIETLSTRFELTKEEITDDFIFNHLKNLLIEKFKQKCEDTIIEGFVATNGHHYRTNRDDQVNMIGKRVEVISNPNIEYVAWKTEDADYIMHTRDEWLKIYDEAFKHKERCLFRYSSLKGVISKATNENEIINLTW